MDLLREGQKLTIFFTKNANMVEMACEIEKVYDDRLDLVLPQYFMRYIEHLQVGNRLTAKAFSKLGTVDFNTVVISSPLEDSFTIELDYNSLKLNTGSNLPTIDAIENLSIKLPEGDYNTKTIEISSGHVKFTSDRKFALNEILNCTLNLPGDYGIINFKASVSDIDKIYTDEYTALYVTMTEDARQNLLYYMYMYTTSTD